MTAQSESAIGKIQWPERVESSSSNDSIERRISGAYLPSEGERLLWNVELPFSAADRATVDDPSCRTSQWKRHFESSAGPFTALRPDPALATASVCFDWMEDAVIPSINSSQSGFRFIELVRPEVTERASR